MQQQLLLTFYDQLLIYTHKNPPNPAPPPPHTYTQALLTTISKIQHIFNNSRPSLQSLSTYISSNLLLPAEPLSPSLTPHEHPVLHCLLLQQNYIVYYTQAVYRLILLGCLCKLGRQAQWGRDGREGRKELETLCEMAGLEFLFFGGEGFAEVLLREIEGIVREGICQEHRWLEIVADVMDGMNLDFVANGVRKILEKKKKDWINKKDKQRGINWVDVRASRKSGDWRRESNWDKKTESKEDSSDQKQCSQIRNTPKITKIYPQQTPNSQKPVLPLHPTCSQSQTLTLLPPAIPVPVQKPTPSSNIRKRISQFREHQILRMSEHLQSSHKRTVFHSRKFKIKCQSGDEYEEEESVYLEKEDCGLWGLGNVGETKQGVIGQIKQQSMQISRTITENIKKNCKKQTKKIPNTDIQQDSMNIAGTPPHKSYKKYQ